LPGWSDASRASAPGFFASNIPDRRLLKKISEARRAKFDERGVLMYVDARSNERNEAYEAFSAAC
jgi:hypothetical protein